MKLGKDPKEFIRKLAKRPCSDPWYDGQFDEVRHLCGKCGECGAKEWMKIYRLVRPIKAKKK